MIPMAYGSAARIAPQPWTFANTTTALWLDASDTATLFDATSGGSLPAADGAVARLNDKSGNARHIIQSTAGARPTRRTAVANGLGVVRFDGSDDVLANASAQLPLRSRLVFIVFRENAAIVNSGLLNLRSATGNDFDSTDGLTIGPGNRTSSRFNIIGSTSTGYVLLDGTSPTVAIPTTIYTEALSGTTGTLYRNGVSISSDAAFAQFSLLSGGGFAIGARYLPNIASPYLNGDFCEAAWIDATGLTTGQVTDLIDRGNGYLAHKWGLASSLATDHPYRNSPPTF